MDAAEEEDDLDLDMLDDNDIGADDLDMEDD